MSRILVTGNNGFVGRHLIDLLQKDDDVTIYGLDIEQGDKANPGFIYSQCDLSKPKEVLQCVEAIDPDFIFHLAAISNPGIARKNPTVTYQVNVMGTVNLLEAAKFQVGKIGMLVIGTSECYGIFNTMEKVGEDHPCRPQGHYGLSKETAEKIALLYNDYGNLEVLCTRSFNHTGPGQRTGFVVPDFTKQVAEIYLGKREKHISVGNLDVVRDFLDVRDVVAAYRTIMNRGESGSVYNVCSGEGVSIAHILDVLIETAGIKGVQIRQKSDKKRKRDDPYKVGDNTRLLSLGWQRIYTLRDTIRDTFRYWVNALS